MSVWTLYYCGKYYPAITETTLLVPAWDENEAHKLEAYGYKVERRGNSTAVSLGEAPAIFGLQLFQTKTKL